MTNRFPVIHTLALSLSTPPPTLYHRYKLLLFTGKRKWYSSFLKYYTLSLLERQGGEGRNEKTKSFIWSDPAVPCRYPGVNKWREPLVTVTKDSRTIHRKKRNWKNHFTHHLLWTRIVSQCTRTIKTIRIGYFYLQNLKTILQLPLDWLRRCFEGVLILLFCGVRFLAVLPSFVVPVQGWLWYRFIDIFYVRSGHCWRRNRSSN